MSLVEADEVPEARSFCSTRSTRSPRPAASRAIPVPVMPPPTVAGSNAAIAWRPAQHGAGPVGGQRAIGGLDAGEIARTHSPSQDGRNRPYGPRGKGSEPDFAHPTGRPRADDAGA